MCCNTKLNCSRIVSHSEQLGLFTCTDSRPCFKAKVKDLKVRNSYLVNFYQEMSAPCFLSSRNQRSCCKCGWQWNHFLELWMWSDGSKFWVHLVQRLCAHGGLSEIRGWKQRQQVCTVSVVTMGFLFMKGEWSKLFSMSIKRMKSHIFLSGSVKSDNQYKP